jgi:hypothetical protein
MGEEDKQAAASLDQDVTMGEPPVADGKEEEESKKAPQTASRVLLCEPQTLCRSNEQTSEVPGCCFFSCHPCRRTMCSRGSLSKQRRMWGSFGSQVAPPTHSALTRHHRAQASPERYSQARH